MNISVLITTYNSEKTISKAIESALSQTLKPYEIIIVDDASDDKTPQIIREYERENEIIDGYYLNNELGIPKVRNFALDKAEGGAITYLDGDDWYYPRKLEKEAKALQKDGVSIAFSNFRYVYEDGSTPARWCEEQTPPTGDIFKECITREFPDGTVFRDWTALRECVIDVGGFDEKLPIFEDWDIKIRLTREYKVGYTSIIGSAYRQHSSGISSRTNYKLKFECWRRIHKKYSNEISNYINSEDCSKQVKSKFDALLMWSKSMAQAESNEQISAISSYIKYLKYEPNSLFQIRDHLFFLLLLSREAMKIPQLSPLGVNK